jgi:hypothetical protein
MKLRQLIHQLRNENSILGEVTREIESDTNYSSLTDENSLKDYLRKRLYKKGMLSGFVELLFTHELINGAIPTT